MRQEQNLEELRALMAIGRKEVDSQIAVVTDRVEVVEGQVALVAEKVAVVEEKVVAVAEAVGEKFDLLKAQGEAGAAANSSNFELLLSMMAAMKNN